MYLLDDLGVLARTLYSDAFSELLTAAAADSFSGLLAATAADASPGALAVAWAFASGAAFFLAAASQRQPQTPSQWVDGKLLRWPSQWR